MEHQSEDKNKGILTSIYLMFLSYPVNLISRKLSSNCDTDLPKKTITNLIEVITCSGYAPSSKQNSGFSLAGLDPGFIFGTALVRIIRASMPWIAGLRLSGSLISPTKTSSAPPIVCLLSSVRTKPLPLNWLDLSFNLL